MTRKIPALIWGGLAVLDGLMVVQAVRERSVPRVIAGTLLGMMAGLNAAALMAEEIVENKVEVA